MLGIHDGIYSPSSWYQTFIIKLICLPGFPKFVQVPCLQVFLLLGSLDHFIQDIIWIQSGRYNVQSQCMSDLQSSMSPGLVVHRGAAISPHDARVTTPQCLRIHLQISGLLCLGPIQSKTFFQTITGSPPNLLLMGIWIMETFLTLFWCLKLTICRSRLVF